MAPSFLVCLWAVNFARLIFVVFTNGIVTVCIAFVFVVPSIVSWSSCRNRSSALAAVSKIFRVGVFLLFCVVLVVLKMAVVISE